MRPPMKKYQLRMVSPRRDISDEEIVDRCILALINEVQIFYLKALLKEQQILMLYTLTDMDSPYGEEDQCIMLMLWV